MKTLNQNKKWSARLTDYLYSTEKEPRPKIGDDDGISDKAMNVVIVLFMLLTVGVTFVAAKPAQSAHQTDAGLFRKALDDMDQMRFEHAISKLLKVKKFAPNNANLDFLLGKCYLYGDVSAEKAAYYLTRATTRIADDYKAWDVSEDRAPAEAIYLLAQAYERTEHFDMAALYYEKFLALLNQVPEKANSRTYAIISRAADKCKKHAEVQHSIAFN